MVRLRPSPGETVAGDESEGQRLQVTEDVPILRIDYSTIQTPLFGVREVAEASLVQGVDALTRVEGAAGTRVWPPSIKVVFG